MNDEIDIPDIDFTCVDEFYQCKKVKRFSSTSVRDAALIINCCSDDNSPKTLGNETLYHLVEVECSPFTDLDQFMTF